MMKKMNWEELDLKIMNDPDSLTEEEQKLAEKIICPQCKEYGRLLYMSLVIITDLAIFECDRCLKRISIELSENSD